MLLATTLRVLTCRVPCCSLPHVTLQHWRCSTQGRRHYHSLLRWHHTHSTDGRGGGQVRLVPSCSVQQVLQPAAAGAWAQGR